LFWGLFASAIAVSCILGCCGNIAKIQHYLPNCHKVVLLALPLSNSPSMKKMNQAKASGSNTLSLNKPDFLIYPMIATPARHSINNTTVGASISTRLDIWS
jgi:hypothetical protein